jgi:hypothetical protein
MLSSLLLVIVATMVSATPESAKMLRMDKERHYYVFVDTRGNEIDLWPIELDVGHRLKCTHRRVDMLRKTLYYLDTDGDGCVDGPEMHTAFGLCLSWYERLGMRLGSIVGSIQTPETTMRDCDRNGDARMCVEDVVRTNYECGNSTVEHHCMCSCQPIDQMFEFILSREPC